MLCSRERPCSECVITVCVCVQTERFRLVIRRCPEMGEGWREGAMGMMAAIQCRRSSAAAGVMKLHRHTPSRVLLGDPSPSAVAARHHRRHYIITWVRVCTILTYDTQTHTNTDTRSHTRSRAQECRSESARALCPRNGRQAKHVIVISQMRINMGRLIISAAHARLRLTRDGRYVSMCVCSLWVWWVSDCVVESTHFIFIYGCVCKLAISLLSTVHGCEWRRWRWRMCVRVCVCVCAWLRVCACMCVQYFGRIIDYHAVHGLGVHREQNRPILAKNATNVLWQKMCSKRVLSTHTHARTLWMCVDSIQTEYIYS